MTSSKMRKFTQLFGELRGEKTDNKLLYLV